MKQKGSSRHRESGLTAAGSDVVRVRNQVPWQPPCWLKRSQLAIVDFRHMATLCLRQASTCGSRQGHVLTLAKAHCYCYPDIALILSHLSALGSDTVRAPKVRSQVPNVAVVSDIYLNMILASTSVCIYIYIHIFICI